MLNVRPVFIVAFARGGSNIILNMLRSHPDLCGPRGETHQVFKGKPDESFKEKLEKRLKYLPILLREGMDVFSTNVWEKRPPLSEFSKRKIDRILFEDKLKARKASQNKFKFQNELYSDEDIVGSRLLTKNLNGLIFLSQELKMMYPDAVFFALIRSGYAVCEGILRRKKNKNQKQLLTIAENYNKACQQIINDTKEISDYYIYRYEDLVANPLESIKRMYEQGGLDFAKVKKVRLESKRIMSNNGNYNVINNQKDKDLIWYNLNDLHRHLSTDANENQMKLLKKDQKILIQETCKASLEYFDY